MILYRPVGTKELELIQDSGNLKYPPRLPEQPIFYPVLNEKYATEIAANWNVKYDDDHKGYVTRFEIDDEYGKQFEIHTVGASYHQELWVPAEELENFNRHIIGKIQVISEFPDVEQHIFEIEECLALLLEHTKLQDVITLPIEQSCGMVLAETVHAEMSVPPYPKSAMDGYAVRAADLEGCSKESPAKFKVKGQLFAGDYEEIRYEKNTAVRVMTGAFLPDGYDAVVRQEDTDYGEEEVTIYTTTKSYGNYCKEGEDIACGDVVVEKGTRLQPVHIGLLAEVGRAEIPVYRPVRVAILCTGTELSEVDKPLQKGKIYNNISYILSASIRQQGLQVVFQGICADEEELLAAKLQEALDAADIVITTGAVSVGKKDIVPAVLQDIGAKILFRRANIQPGTPTTGSVKDGKIILSLSGNPYAALVNFEIYFWSLMAKMMQHKSFDSVRETVILRSEYPKTNKMRRFIRARAENGSVYLPTEVHASSVIHNLAECNCLIDLEPGCQVQAGDEVRVIRIKGM